MEGALLFDNRMGENLFKDLEQNVAENLTTFSTMLEDFSASLASGGQFENYAAPGGDVGNYTGSSGFPGGVPCLHTGDQVLAQLNFHKVEIYVQVSTDMIFQHSGTLPITSRFQEGPFFMWLSFICHRFCQPGF
jgi:hypothetical protein